MILDTDEIIATGARLTHAASLAVAWHGEDPPTNIRCPFCKALISRDYLICPACKTEIP